MIGVVQDLQALVLSPTRELAEQSRNVMLALGDYMSARCHACIGGKSIGDDIRALEAGLHAVSGTPGRVYDMIKRCGCDWVGLLYPFFPIFFCRIVLSHLNLPKSFVVNYNAAVDMALYVFIDRYSP